MHFRPAAIGLYALQILSSKHKAYKKRRIYKTLIPHIEFTKDGHVKMLENFGDYVARQLGIKEGNTRFWLSNLANEYLKGSMSSSGESRENIFACLTGLYSEDEIDSFYIELIREFEACMLSYFAFHWNHSSVIIDQVLEGNYQRKKKLRAAVISATRKHRLERVLKTLGTKNVFSTLLEQLKAIGKYMPHSHESNVAIPVNARERHPILLLVGGGMGSGKSSVVNDILKSSFCSSIAENAVIVEADAFKETNLIYQALNSDGHHYMLETAEFVHKSSTDAASSLLVAAMNEGRDIIFDGTMSWEPFVKQTLAMARDIHLRNYSMGPGYQVDNDGHVHENYWEPIEQCIPDAKSLKQGRKENPFSEATGCEEIFLETRQLRKPYRIVLIGVICDPSIAVSRGIRRAILTRRGVRIRDQLLSHKMFADAFYNYSEDVDHVKLYCTDKGQAKLVGVKESNGKMQVNPEGVSALRKLSLLNPNAQSICELYEQQNESHGIELEKFWKDIVMSFDRFSQQENLRKKIQRVDCFLSEKDQMALATN